ncbi:MAG: Rrf2 family transcriptional regulator [Oliverpabstia sp.]|nr:Rrf2 family transcriptional regulator [Lachnospiraceae bacterium]MDY5027235.1 Rrf2 family transcriptional regulator [Oliverpabstia sp.]
MKLSKKCRYALRALIDLSVNSGNEHIVLSGIAERNQISPQYLEQVFASLRRAGIVKGIKGSQGGYQLKLAPEKITVASILEAVDGSFLIEDEEVPEDSHGRATAVTIQELVINQVNNRLDHILQSITLADLRKKYLDNKDYDQDMYYI